MARKWIGLAAVAVVAVVCGSKVKAQSMPFIDLNGMAQQNIAFGNYMNQRALEQSWAIARSLPPGYQVQLNMPAFQRSMAGYNQAAANYIGGMQQNSARTSAAINHWNQTFNGNALYTSTYGGTGYYLPWSGGSAYNVGPSGFATPGVRWDSGFNVYAH